MNMADVSNDNDIYIKSIPLPKYINFQKNFNSNDSKQNNLLCMNVAIFEKNNNDVCAKNTLLARYSSQKNFGSNGNQNNLSSVATSIEYSLADINSNVDSRQYVFKELSPKSGNSGRAVSQILLPSTEFQERSRWKGVQTKWTKSKGKSQSDFFTKCSL